MGSISPEDRCVACSMGRGLINSRGAFLNVSKIYGRVIDDLIEGEAHLGYGSMICRSCSSGESNLCIDCGLSELVMIRNITSDENMIFIEGSEFPRVYRCPECYDRNTRYEQSIQREIDTDLYTCSYCEREWDGNAQCPCTMGVYSSDEEDEEDSLKKESLIQREIMNILDILEINKEGLRDGDYLNAMNGLKKLHDHSKRS